MGDDEVVNPNQIRTIIRNFKDHLPDMFPERFSENNEFEVPKTLIFAKTDSHADDIIQIVREEFAEENRFCKKLTYKSEEDTKSVLAQFRNAYHPRIAVTVDMIATGTDVKPLECLLFMRDVKSRNYFEQMKGRGTRTISLDDLRKVSPSAKYTKDHFVIVDAVGVTKSLKTDSRPLEKKPTIPLKDLLGAIAVGVRDDDLFSSIANRLIRLEKQITEKEKNLFLEKAKGKTINQAVKELLNAYDPDIIKEIRLKIELEFAASPPVEKMNELTRRHNELIEIAASTFTGDLNSYIENVRKAHEQIIDDINRDKIIFAGWDKDNKSNAAELVEGFKSWIESHKNEIVALQIFYNQPLRRREITFKMMKELIDHLISDKPLLAPMHIWQAYSQVEKVTGSPKNEMIALISLLRKITGIDKDLTSFDKTVDKNFREWVFKKQAGTLKFNDAQMSWLRMIKDHIATSIHIEYDDLDYTPFDALGGKGKMWQLFGEDCERIIAELNEVIAA